MTEHKRKLTTLCERIDVDPGEHGMGHETECTSEAKWMTNDRLWVCSRHAKQLIDEDDIEELLSLRPPITTHPIRHTKLRLKELPDKVDLEGQVDEKNNVSYLGVAKRQPDGAYHCLANVGGALCIVSVILTLLKD